MVNSRQKGAAFERECAKHINNMLAETHINDRVKRNLDQYQRKNLPDLKLRHINFECKNYGRRENNWYREKWWQQACDASAEGEIPILIFKFDYNPIRVTFPLHMLNSNIDINPNHYPVAFTSLEDFLEILKTEVQAWKED